MGNEVYVNGREVSCKSADGKSICAFPDVCLTPPTPPAGFIPVPYPNTGYATDATNGSKTVVVSDKEVMLKNKSYFKKSTGDEAATRSTPMGTVTHTITGKVYFNSWSMDVKIEGENAVRHLDLTTHNHMSVPGDTPTWPYLDKLKIPATHPCHQNKQDERTACAGLEVKNKKGEVKLGATKKKQCANTPAAKACREAQKCMLRPWRPNRCCKGEQGHHLVEAHCFSPVGKRGKRASPGLGGYKDKKAPCVCATGPRHAKEHGALHAVQQQFEAKAHASKGGWTYGEARNAGVVAHQTVYPHCDPACIQKQLDAYHNQDKPKGPGADDSTDLRTDPQASTRSAAPMTAALKTALKAAVKTVLGIATGTIP